MTAGGTYVRRGPLIGQPCSKSCLYTLISNPETLWYEMGVVGCKHGQLGTITILLDPGFKAD